MGRCAERAAVLTTVLVFAGSALATDLIHKEFHFKVRRHASISVLNEYGPITVHPVAGHQVIVNAYLHSPKVEVNSSQRGSRVEFVSHLLPGANADSGTVDYDVLLPADASVTLDACSGSIYAEGLRGDVTLVGNSGAVEVKNVSNGHVHIKTLDGPITLTNVSDGHVEVTSVGGQVTMTSVSGSRIDVNTNKGNIAYNGDFGGGGEYLFMTNTGNIDATAPAYASISVSAQSMKGQVVNDFPLHPNDETYVVTMGSSFFGYLGKAASSVKLVSWSGKIHLKKHP
ncbi:MAG TPA: DUF4097 family beta strand repeat-containing protein [Terriglobales bacterium]